MRNDDAGTLALDLLCDPALAPFFRLPDRRGTNSAWWGHVPFAGWLVAHARPRSLVELGSFAGVSYFAFCQAVLAERLNCSCHAVDTWQGDPHAGHYDDSIYNDFKQFNDARYAGISTMHRCTFDQAAGDFADGTIDLLHIDGFHTYEAVRHDFETWLPKLSERGVVLFHDANERMADFGVWRFWEEVAERWPSFLFLHSHGLGVLCVGADAPEAVRALCTADEDRVARVRERVDFLGSRWYAETQWVVAVQAAGSAARPDLDAESEQYAAVRHYEERLAAFERSTSWRVTAPLRAVGRAVGRLRRGIRMNHPALAQPGDTATRAMRQAPGTFEPPSATVQPRPRRPVPSL